MRTLYFDCFAGASGNMILGGLAALGVDRDELISQLNTVAPVRYGIQFEDVVRSGIAAVHTNVTVPDEKKHRHLADIEKIIDGSGVSAGVKGRSKAIFGRLADAEGKVHGVEASRIHFHEVGAMDAIVDVVGSCIGFEMLGIERFICSKIHVGSGFIDIAHGKFPVPPPAVVELLKGVPYYSTEIPGELATPTGMAIITTLCAEFGSSPELTIEQIGYGAGTREYEKFPNVLRMMVGETRVDGSSAGSEELILLETNIDDLSPQILGYVMDRAFDLGALDCWFTPIQMKKNRPAVMLSILCGIEKRAPLTELLYKETTTLGIRVRTVERECLDREIVRVSTDFGDVDVKIGMLRGKLMNAMPEYEQVKRIALEKGTALRVVRDAALAAFNAGKSKSATS
ncbi:MAG TPA: nickel pincer cofactor biosynthesis protein LarC [Pyrinomonadaceae bacterium]|nr:nickel pincer cofactor biosynthesis protein LarC [Pyrinomonadaceae bacterium]